MEDLIAPLPAGSQKLGLEDKSNNATGNVKRPAPSAGGCRIEGYVRVKKVKFLLKKKWELFCMYSFKLIGIKCFKFFLLMFGAHVTSI